MGVRARLGKGLDARLGKERTDQIRGVERQTRQYLADKIAPRPPRSLDAAAADAPAASAVEGQESRDGVVLDRLGEPNDRQGGWIPSDPFVPHPEPTMTRHDLLRGLHEVLSPRTYLEIGVNEGSSLTLSRTRSIGVDPDFIVRRPLRCDLDLVKAKSDEFFTRPEALAHFDGVPIDLAFIDGMHLSEFALRDFINVERHLAPSGVTVFDDILPRNALEAAHGCGEPGRGPATSIRRWRSSPVVGRTWRSYSSTHGRRVRQSWSAPTRRRRSWRSPTPRKSPISKAPDPQSPPQEYMSRSAAVDPAVLLVSEAWPLLVAARESGDATLIDKAKDILRSIPTFG